MNSSKTLVASRRLCRTLVSGIGGTLLIAFLMTNAASSSMPGRSIKGTRGSRDADEPRKQEIPASTTPTTAHEGKPLAIPDVEVLDQTGAKTRFYTDLVKGKVVVINFVYTNCRTICPPQGMSFSKLQARLGDRLGKDVYLISISIDPEYDTPQRLKKWGAMFGAKKGWTMITGEKPKINDLVKVLTGDAIRKEDHGFLILIGSDARQSWVRAYGLANPSELIDTIDSVSR